MVKYKIKTEGTEQGDRWREGGTVRQLWAGAPMEHKMEKMPEGRETKTRARDLAEIPLTNCRGVRQIRLQRVLLRASDTLVPYHVTYNVP